MDPDNGRWVAADFNMNDPRMTLLSPGPQISIPAMLSPPPAPPPPRRPVFFKEGKNDNDRKNDESHCGMDAANGLLKGKTWIDCMVQKGWGVRPSAPPPRPTSSSIPALQNNETCKASLAGDGTLPQVSTVDDREYYDVDAGERCRLLVAKGAHRGGKMTWSGSCNSRGYAEGQGIWRAYNASGCLAMINKSWMKDGRISTSEGVFGLSNGVITGPRGRVDPSQLPDWAREMAGSR